MNTFDVSRVPEYLQYLEGHKQTLKRAQGFKGRPARSRKSRDEIVMQFMFRQMMHNDDPKSSVHIRSSFLPLAYTPCIVSYNDLSKVMIKDLYLETHHRGRYLLLRTITPTTL
jgi:hypothetical protein